MITLFSTVGEQPIPNLLVARHVQPDHVVLLSTERTGTVGDRLQKVLQGDGVSITRMPDIEAFAPAKISDRIRQFVAGKSLQAEDLVFDLTGGTKMMSLGLFDAAQTFGARGVYCETDSRGSRLYSLKVDARGQLLDSDPPVPFSGTFRLDEYLALYLGKGVGQGYTENPSNPFANKMEEAVAAAIRSDNRFDECMFNVRPVAYSPAEADFIVRCGQRVGIGEVKANAKMNGLVHITSFGEQRHLGTYVEKFLVSGNGIAAENRPVCKAYRVTPIELDGCTEHTQTLSDENRLVLLDTLARMLGAGDQ